MNLFSGPSASGEESLSLYEQQSTTDDDYHSSSVYASQTTDETFTSNRDTFSHDDMRSSGTFLSARTSHDEEEISSIDGMKRRALKLTPKSELDLKPVPSSQTFREAPTPVAANRSPRRERIPGGAAAKLMFIGPSASSRSTTDDDRLQGASTESSSQGVDDNIKEIDREMQRAKAEFEKGTERNRRYQQHPVVTIPEDQEDTTIDDESASNAPSFLNRSEIFHESSQAAVIALLTPRDRHGDLRSTASDFNDGMSVQSGASKISSNLAAKSPSDRNIESPVKQQDVSQPLLSQVAERRLEAIKARMKDPNKRLTELLMAIATPDDRSLVDLGYMVRRKNACGALHVLTARPENRVAIGWTVGVLPALTSVLEDSQEEELEVILREERIRAEYEAARERAIATLMNLAMPRENRIAVFHSPGLVQAALYVIHEDEGVARRGCSALLAFLVKSPENRLLLPQVPGFMDTVIKVLRPKPPQVQEPAPQPRKIYPWNTSDSEESDDESEDRTKRSRSYQTSYSKTTATDSEDVANGTFETDFTEGSRPRVESDSGVELTGYDGSANKLLSVARQNIFAVFLHLMKEKDNAYHFAREDAFISTMVDISTHQESLSHTLATKLLANLTRHRLNTKLLVFQKRVVVPALVSATASPYEEARRFACHGLQNIAQDKSCRQELATTKNLILQLCDRARQATGEEERLAAVSALKNLCDEPANLIPMTNTPDCISTLMHVAHGKEEGVTDMMQYRACDALATLSHWLRKIATSGQSLTASQVGSPAPQGLCVPSLRVVTWNQWR